jgi:hypothetical protein
LKQKQFTPSGTKGNLLAAESFLLRLKDKGKDLHDINPDTIYRLAEHLAIERRLKINSRRALVLRLRSFGYHLT